MKVLVVEDNQALRDLLASYIRNTGLCSGPSRVRVEKELQEKLSENPNLILMDIIMPVMEGSEAARARTTSNTKNLPIWQ